MTSSTFTILFIHGAHPPLTPFSVLDASSHLSERVCPSVRMFVCPSIRNSEKPPKTAISPGKIMYWSISDASYCPPGLVFASVRPKRLETGARLICRVLYISFFSGFLRLWLKESWNRALTQGRNQGWRLTNEIQTRDPRHEDPKRKFIGQRTPGE